MEYYVSSVDDFLNDGATVGWLTSRSHLVINDSNHISAFVKKIKENLSTLRRDLTMVLETDYIDSVYRDSYYSYFSTKLKPFFRFCVRISFFEPIFSTLDGFFKLDETDIKNNYLGFIVIRPLGKCIGRNAISPRAKVPPLATSIKVCLADINASCLGVKLRVKAFPHSSQDGEFMTCAETTTWTLAEYFGNKYVLYTPLLPSTLIKSLEMHAIERLVPSQGLTIEQISMALSQQGFSCKMYSNTNSRFKELFTCYVESGLPLAVAVKGVNCGHAIVCIGRRSIDRTKVLQKKTLLGVDYYVWNESIDDFIFNDDNKPSYIEYSFNKPTPYLPSASISHFIVPLHKKIYLPADQAIDISHFLVSKDFQAASDSVIRTFLTSGRSFREYIYHNTDFPVTVKMAYLGIDLPKFIWVTEVASRSDFESNKVNSLILLDATSPSSKNDPYAPLLLKQDKSIITIYDKKSKGLMNLTVLSLPPKFESFNGNLY